MALIKFELEHADSDLYGLAVHQGDLPGHVLIGMIVLGTAAVGVFKGTSWYYSTPSEGSEGAIPTEGGGETRIYVPVTSRTSVGDVLLRQSVGKKRLAALSGSSVPTTRGEAKCRVIDALVSYRDTLDNPPIALHSMIYKLFDEIGTFDRAISRAAKPDEFQDAMRHSAQALGQTPSPDTLDNTALVVSFLCSGKPDQQKSLKNAIEWLEKELQKATVSPMFPCYIDAVVDRYAGMESWNDKTAQGARGVIAEYLMCNATVRGMKTAPVTDTTPTVVGMRKELLETVHALGKKKHSVKAKLPVVETKSLTEDRENQIYVVPNPDGDQWYLGGKEKK